MYAALKPIRTLCVPVLSTCVSIAVLAVTRSCRNWKQTFACGESLLSLNTSPQVSLLVTSLWQNYERM